MAEITANGGRNISVFVEPIHTNISCQTKKENISCQTKKEILKMEVDSMSDEKVTQTETTQEQQQEQQQTVDMKTYLDLVAKMEKMEQILTQEAEKQKEIEAKQQELWQKQVQLTLQENGLEKFVDIVKVNDEDELADVVKKLTAIVNEIKIQTGYIPADHAKTDEYPKYEKEKNVTGMIAVKLSKLFK